MITKEIEIDGEKFRLVLTDQIINQVNNLNHFITLHMMILKVLNKSVQKFHQLYRKFLMQLNQNQLIVI